MILLNRKRLAYHRLGLVRCLLPRSAIAPFVVTSKWLNEKAENATLKKLSVVSEKLCFLLWKTWKNQGISLWSVGNNPVKRTGRVARTRKRCAFKDSVSYAPGLSTVSAKKRAKIDLVVFCRTTPPP